MRQKHTLFYTLEIVANSSHSCAASSSRDLSQTGYNGGRFRPRPQRIGQPSQSVVEVSPQRCEPSVVSKIGVTDLEERLDPTSRPGTVRCSAKRGAQHRTLTDLRKLGAPGLCSYHKSKGGGGPHLRAHWWTVSNQGTQAMATRRRND